MSIRLGSLHAIGQELVMVEAPQVQWQVGQQVEGFEVTRVQPLAELRAVAYQLEHRGSGARLLHLHTLDSENLFSIVFRTPAADDTGVPHILEHAVLGGSRKYPVKDPFMEMVKMSMATFINAMTGSDRTYYPVASNVRQDFYNLAEVYFDAVFHPILALNTFLQEGHHLELARKGDLQSELIIKGIVYNEMKGAYSSPESIVGRQTLKWLLPDTTYGHDSGGDPEVIPDLTYEQFTGFHKDHYHPSNAFIFLYGDIPTLDHLRFLGPKLDAFARRDLNPAIPRQATWSKPREGADTYPVGPGDPTAEKAYITLSWLAGDGTNPQEVLALSVIEAILLGHQGAPLRKAIIDSKLGQDLTFSGTFTGSQEVTFHVGIKGSEADRKQAFVDLVLHTLEEAAASGITQERVAAAMQQMAYYYLEISSQFPLRLMSRVCSTWLTGQDPLTYLQAQQHLRTLKERYAQNPQLFGDLIRERLIRNPHRLLAVFTPDPNQAAATDAKLAGKLADLKQTLTPEQLAQIDAQAQELEKHQNTPNSPEAVALLPQLKVSDLPRKPRHIPTQVERIAEGVELLRNDVFANGVNYLQIDFDLNDLPPDLLLYLPLYGDCVSKMGAAGQDYVQIAQRVAACTGGLSLSPYADGHFVDADRTLLRARLGLKFLDDKAADALQLVQDLMFGLDVRDKARLKDVVLQRRTARRSALVNNGVSLAMAQAARRFSRVTQTIYQLGHLPQNDLLENLGSHFDQRYDLLVEKLEAIRQTLLNQRRMVASFTGTGRVYEQVRQRIESWAGQMSSQAVGPMTIPFAAGEPLREGIAVPIQVAYDAMALPAPHVSHPDAALMMVGSRLLARGYITEEVRFKGTAYGGGCNYEASDSVVKFFSYRDPWVLRTLKVFEAAAQHVREATWSQLEIDRTIIGVAKEGERPIRPEDATGTALSRHIIGDTPARREARYERVIGAQAPEVRRSLLQTLEQGRDRAGVCVVSSREKIEEANRELGAGALQVIEVVT